MYDHLDRIVGNDYPDPEDGSEACNALVWRTIMTCAPGPVGRLVDAEGQISLMQSCEPSGETLRRSGEGAN